MPANRLHLVSVVALSLLMVGCATTRLAAWEYRVVNIGSDQPDMNWMAAQQRILNELGQDGWVLVQQHPKLDGVFYMKRLKK